MYNYLNFTQSIQLGEILKAYGHFQEAALHLRHVLELRPNHQPAALILKERITPQGADPPPSSTCSEGR